MTDTKFLGGWVTELPIAHRGLHNGVSAIENSVSAFGEAIRMGYAIECDIQNTKTEPVVFHDPELDRLTGVSGRVRDMTHTELRGITLKNGEPICSLEEILEVVGGRVPLIVEIKDEGMDGEYISKIAGDVGGYSGKVALMSFNADIVREVREVMPDVVRGLVAEGDDSMYDKHRRSVDKAEPHFVSYNVNHLPNRFVGETKKQMPVITWTVRNEEQEEITRMYADQMTFEGFQPEVSGVTEAL